jgi:Fe2+ transport system protein B
VPFTLLVNKIDLVRQWEIREDLLEILRQKGWRVIKTSAKTGDDVDQAFMGLARAMLEA